MSSYSVGVGSPQPTSPVQTPEQVILNGSTTPTSEQAPTNYANQGVLNPEQTQLIVDYLSGEVRRVADAEDRQQFLENVRTWRRQRVGRPKSKTVDYPWPNASNVCTPVTMSNTNAMSAKVLSMLRKRKPRIAVTTNAPEYKEHGPVISKVLNRLNENPFLINMRRKDQEIVYETVSLGTHFVEVPWVEIVRGMPSSDSAGTQSTTPLTIYSGPMPNSMRLERVLMWSTFDDVNEAPWVSLEYHMTSHEIKQLAAQQFFDQTAVDQVLLSPITQLEIGDLEEKQRLGVQPVFLQGDSATYKIYKTYCYWDLNDDGYPEDVIVWFSLDKKLILRSEMNLLPKRPIALLGYIPIPGELYKMGIGWMSENVQEEIDSIHNIRINSQHLSSLQMLARKRGASWGDQEAFGPAKVIDMDDPQLDWKLFGFQDVSQSTFPGEQYARQYLDRAIGVSDGTLGMPDAVMRTRATAAGTIFQANQANDILGVIFESFLDGYQQIYMLELMQLVANDVPSRSMVEGLCDTPEEIALIGQILDLTAAQIPELFHFTVEVSPEEQTEDAKRQGILMLNQLYTGFEQSLLQGYQILNSAQATPEMKEVESRIMLGRIQLMDETLKMFGYTDPSEFLPYAGTLEAMNMMLDQLLQQKTAVMGAAIGASNGQNNGQMAGGGAPLGPDLTGGGAAADVTGAGSLGQPTGVSDYPSGPEGTATPPSGA